MSFPVEDANHVAEGLKLLTDHYRNKTVIPGVLSAFLARCQEIEDMLWGVIEAGLISTPPTGDALTRLGGIVGLPRDTADDAEFLSEIILQIRVNRSQGVASDVVDVATLAAGAASMFYTEINDSFLVEMFDISTALITAPTSLEKFLKRTRPPGVRGVLAFTNWPTGNDFIWGSVYSASAGQGGWGSVYDVGLGGLFGACVEV